MALLRLVWPEGIGGISMKNHVFQKECAFQFQLCGSLTRKNFLEPGYFSLENESNTELTVSFGGLKLMYIIEVTFLEHCSWLRSTPPAIVLKSVSTVVSPDTSLVSFVSDFPRKDHGENGVTVALNCRRALYKVILTLFKASLYLSSEICQTIFRSKLDTFLTLHPETCEECSQLLAQILIIVEPHSMITD